jgi:outer membrane protein OmpA-like peptidoglycan-associated protein
MSMEIEVAPSRIKKIVGALLMALVVSSGAAIAQQQPASSSTTTEAAPKYEFFAGYSWYDPRGYYETDDNPGVALKAPSMDKGFGVAGTKNWGNLFGLTIDVSGHFQNDMRVGTFLAGPQVKWRAEHFQPFAHILGGVGFLKPEHTSSGGQWQPMIGGGGGFDLMVTPRWGIRVFQADYIYTNWEEGVPTGQPGRWNSVRLQGGLIWTAGLGAPTPVTAACSAQPSSVMAGEPVKVIATPTGFNPKRTLSYTWSSTGGKVAGTDAATTVDTTGLAPGTYTVKSTVSDGGKHPSIADCNATFTVNEPPKHPPTISCSETPSTVRAGDACNVSCSGNSPDGRPLTYNHSASSGRLSPNGANAVVDTTGLSAGPVTISSTVSDDRGLTASTTTSCNVEVPAAPPTASKLNEITFPNEKKPARVDNTAKAILDDVALRLQREPDSKAVVVGYATTEESKKKINKNLAAQRAVNTKACLDGAEASCENQGKQIDPSRLEVRTGTGDQNKAEIWIVPSGASFTGEGTTPVDESKFKAQARTRAEEQAGHHKKAAKKKAE